MGPVDTLHAMSPWNDVAEEKKVHLKPQSKLEMGNAPLMEMEVLDMSCIESIYHQLIVGANFRTRDR